ncbi:MAG: hypothetical protein J0I77_08450 [Rudaea sp.]|uniref:hypothetical protein n=1 Tax=unclassified Rudaea TaxID=2627037 RepID=UPI001485C0DF|nr:MULTISPECIES: hypothetical protein [unclassified Rudaea]MBN8885738.1 hypothetical protein [Rudaea sp.]
MQPSDQVPFETFGKLVEQFRYEDGRLRARRFTTSHGLTKSSDRVVRLIGLPCHAAANVARRPSDQIALELATRTSAIDESCCDDEIAHTVHPRLPVACDAASATFIASTYVALN